MAGRKGVVGVSGRSRFDIIGFCRWVQLMKNDLARHVEGARGGASQEREPGGSPFCVVCGRHTATVGRVDLRQRGER